MEPRSSETLRLVLKGLDGRDYGAYQSLRGEYRFRDFRLTIARVPKDPYAPPHTGIYRVDLPLEYLGESVPGRLESSADIAFRDYLARRFAAEAFRIAGRRRGTGFSGIIAIDSPGQSILDRVAVTKTPAGIEVRCFIGLPGRGRQVDGDLAERMLLEELPEIIAGAFSDLDTGDVRRHIEAAEDAESLRAMLPDLGLVAFVAEGAILPRMSGTSDRPMPRQEAVPFTAPESLRRTVNLPCSGRVTGIGIPKGVTLIVGGGYHGKSTLLEAIERGIYNHIPGDGREYCVTEPGAVKVRAYSGRHVNSTDISPFIRELPFGKRTNVFSSSNASGSTSQAAAIVEAMEAGATTLMMDEDTCATNFMVRDRLMRRLVPDAEEPITPFIDRVRWLYETSGVSSILVVGGVGDYFAAADTVIRMKEYRPMNVTEASGEIARESGEDRIAQEPEMRRVESARLLDPLSIDPCNEHGKRSVYAKETSRIFFGRTEIDLNDVEQIDELSQTKAVSEAIQWLGRELDEPVSLPAAVKRVEERIKESGLDGLTDRLSANLAEFRGMELAAALNRLRTATITASTTE